MIEEIKENIILPFNLVLSIKLYFKRTRIFIITPVIKTWFENYWIIENSNEKIDERIHICLEKCSGFYEYQNHANNESKIFFPSLYQDNKIL